MVLLEGSAKNPKLVWCATTEIPDDAEDPLEFAQDFLREQAKQNKLPGESVGLAVDSGLAAFRTLKLPFADTAKIEQVIKFEVESQLPQWEIEDVIIDWHRLASSPVESELIVTAVPKAALQTYIDVCAKAGLEPQEVELEATAMVNAAHHAGAFDPESSQILVHVGDGTTSVAVLEGGELRSMRAVHIGASTAAPVEGDEEQPIRNLARSGDRLRKELARTLASEQLELPISAVYFCGAELPGLAGETIDGVPILPLEDILPSDAALEGVDRGLLVGAYGAALRQLGGGVLTPRLRREGLAYAGKFERVELPLAVLMLLVVTLLSVQILLKQKQIGYRGAGADTVEEQAQWGDLQRWLYMSNSRMLDDLKSGSQGRLSFDPPKDLVDYAKRAQTGLVEDRGKYDQLLRIRGLLDSNINRIEREMGVVGEIKQPMSALHGMVLVLDRLESLGDDVGLFSIRRAVADTADAKGGGRSAEHVVVTLDMTFFADDSLEATEHYTNFVDDVESQPWSIDFERRPSSPLEGGKGLSVDGMRIQIDVAAALQLNAEGGQS